MPARCGRSCSSGRASVTPSEPKRLHPLTPFFDLILFGRQLAAPIVVALVAGRDSDGGQLLFAVPVLLGTLYGALRWWRFTYAFDGAHLVIDEGVLTRKRRVIPVDRVQQVELHAKLRHRLLGVTVLRVDTAGGGGDAEVDLSVVSVAEAARLRSILVPQAGGRVDGADGTAPMSPASDADVLVRLSVWQLAIAGMTGSELALMLTFVGWMIQLVDDLSVDVLEDLDGRLTAPSSAAGFAGAALTVLVAWLGLAALAGVVKHFGFEMRREGVDLRVRRGLFDQREASMPFRRLQAVVVVQSIARRALGLASVVLQSGGQATSSSGGVSRIDVPLLTAGDVEPLVRQLLPTPGGWSLAGLRSHPPAARRRAVVRRVVVLGGAAVGPAVLLGGAEGVALVSLAVVVAAVAGELAYQGLGHASSGGIVTARAGGVARRTAVVPAGKVQSSRLRSSPFQRRAGLATLTIDVAGKGPAPTIRDGDADELRRLQGALVLAPDLRADEAEARAAQASAAVGAPSPRRNATT